LLLVSLATAWKVNWNFLLNFAILTFKLFSVQLLPPFSTIICEQIGDISYLKEIGMKKLFEVEKTRGSAIFFQIFNLNFRKPLFFNLNLW
jgi:hypothetical protein